MSQSVTNFSKFAWGVLGYNILVILFGAFVRATGSGAGCGAHWPLCNGVIIPRPERIETIIEFTHRITSGILLPMVIILVFWAWRVIGKGSPIRKSVALALLFTITEALVGAGLVVFRLVGDNDSIVRALSMILHLVNTFLLTASLALTAWWSFEGEPEGFKARGLSGVYLLIGAIAILILGASGAVAALGDTIYPASSLVEALREDISTTTHYLIQLRKYHPAIAVSVGIYLYLAMTWVCRRRTGVRLELLTNILLFFYAIQLLAGLLNVVLLAPVWMQIVHLLITNLIWITFVILASEILGRLFPRPIHQPVDEPIHAVSREKTVNHKP